MARKSTKAKQVSIGALYDGKTVRELFEDMLAGGPVTVYKRDKPLLTLQNADEAWLWHQSRIAEQEAALEQNLAAAKLQTAHEARKRKQEGFAEEYKRLKSLGLK